MRNVGRMKYGKWRTSRKTPKKSSFVTANTTVLATRFEVGTAVTVAHAPVNRFVGILLYDISMMFSVKSNDGK